MEEDNLLNVYASKFIYESGLRDVALYGKPKGDWKCRLVDFDYAKHAIFEWYYRDDLITTTYSYVSVLDDPHMMAFIISKAKEIMKELPNKDIMEEKKTRKMTKAEAFEYLKGKKIKCICAVAHEDAQANKVEKFLKDVGCKYHFANHISWCDWYWPLYGFIVDKKGEIYVAFENQKDFFEQDFSELISVDDILSIEIVEENRSEDELVEIVELGKQIRYWLSKLSGHRHVVITENDVILYDEGMSLFHSDPF